MPRLDNRVRNCAFFLFRRDPKSGEQTGPWGTGALISIDWTDVKGWAHYYAVTNWHLAIQHGATIMRLNRPDGTARTIELETEDWHFDPKGDDLAVADITDQVRGFGDQIVVISDANFVDTGFIDDHEIGMGEDAIMIGLFADHPGKRQNLPVGRFGNLSMVADPRNLIEQPNGNWRPTHIVDMRSRGGFSGSPVFIYRTPYSDLSMLTRGRETVKDGFRVNNQFLRLLGIHCGQFPEKATVAKAEKFGDPVRDGDTLIVPGGMTLVVPAWRISELLYADYFKKIRVKRERQHIAISAGLAISEGIAEAPSSSDSSSDGRSETK